MKMTKRCPDCGATMTTTRELAADTRYPPYLRMTRTVEREACPHCGTKPPPENERLQTPAGPRR